MFLFDYLFDLTRRSLRNIMLLGLLIWNLRSKPDEPSQLVYPHQDLSCRNGLCCVPVFNPCMACVEGVSASVSVRYGCFRPRPQSTPTLSHIQQHKFSTPHASRMIRIRSLFLYPASMDSAPSAADPNGVIGALSGAPAPSSSDLGLGNPARPGYLHSQR